MQALKIKRKEKDKQTRETNLLILRHRTYKISKTILQSTNHTSYQKDDNADPKSFNQP